MKGYDNIFKTICITIIFQWMYITKMLNKDQAWVKLEFDITLKLQIVSTQNKLIEAKWRIYASAVYTMISSDNDWTAPSHYLNTCWNILVRTVGTKFIEILSEIDIFSAMKIHLKISSGKWRPFCFGLGMLTHWDRDKLAAIFQQITAD